MQKDSAKLVQNEVLGADSLFDSRIGNKERKGPEGKVTNWMLPKADRIHVRTEVSNAKNNRLECP